MSVINVSSSAFEAMQDEGTGTGGDGAWTTTTEPEGLTGCEQQQDEKDAMWKGMAIGFGGGAGLILVLLVFGKMMGYSVEKKGKVNTAYNLMQENSGMTEMSHGAQNTTM